MTDITWDGAHLCWVVEDDAEYVPTATRMLEEGRARGEKVLAFGPAGSEDLAALAAHADAVLDPREAFLAGGRLDGAAMFDAFAREVATARDEGYTGLRVVADMSWLPAGDQSLQDVVTFELLLDRALVGLDASVACAYRTSTFDAGTIDALLCVHPAHRGHEPSPFSLVAAPNGEDWRLSGEVDVGCAPSFAAALAAARSASGDIDATGLEFIDVAGLRAVATAVDGSSVPLRLHGAHDTVGRTWRLAGFHRLAPVVELG
jgi:anti-anti-sigma factor